MSSTTIDDTAKKLHKVQGQIQGVVAMYDEGRSCLEVVQQIAAIRSALSGISKDVLTKEACKCAKERTSQDFDRVLKSLLDLA